MYCDVCDELTWFDDRLPAAVYCHHCGTLIMSEEAVSAITNTTQNDAASVTAVDKLIYGAYDEGPDDTPDTPEDKKPRGRYSQWSSHDDSVFVPAAKTTPRLTPAIYSAQVDQKVGLHLVRTPVLDQDLIRFPETNIDKVVNEIELFWDRQGLFDEYRLPHKRGIILYGPPGSGKSCAIQLIIRDVIRRQGICLQFTYPPVFVEGLRVIREIEPDTPVVVIMEDLDSIIARYNESEVLNLLDGVNQSDRIVFLATTNYPEKLGPRIIDRPSRFDKRIEIDWPNEESRRIYLRHLIGADRLDEFNVDLDKWVDDTDEFSFAHLKELFVATVIMGDPYRDAIETLRHMRDDKVDGRGGAGSGFGF